MPAPPAFTPSSNFPLHPGFAPLIGSPPNTLLPSRPALAHPCPIRQHLWSLVADPASAHSLSPVFPALTLRSSLARPSRQTARSDEGTQSRHPGTSFRPPHSRVTTCRSPPLGRVGRACTSLYLLRRGFTGLNVVSPLKPITAHARRLLGIEYSYNESAADPSFQHRDVASP